MHHALRSKKLILGISFCTLFARLSFGFDSLSFSKLKMNPSNHCSNRYQRTTRSVRVFETAESERNMSGHSGSHPLASFEHSLEREGRVVTAAPRAPSHHERLKGTCPSPTDVGFNGQSPGYQSILSKVQHSMVPIPESPPESPPEKSGMIAADPKKPPTIPSKPQRIPSFYEDEGASVISFEKEQALPRHSTRPGVYYVKHQQAAIPSSSSSSSASHYSFISACLPSPTHSKKAIDPAWHRPLVEIHPGYSVPLRGSDETWHAYCHDNVASVDCTACLSHILCIASASMVLCPNCRMISPTYNEGIMEGGYPTESLGLGLSQEYAAEELEYRRRFR